MSANFKPLAWKCERDGCFNTKNRLKFEVFYSALPGRISFTDIDAITEYCGNALMLEWKKLPGELPTGQRILFQRITKGRSISAICVAGDAETMTVTHVGRWFDGKWYDWQEETTCGLKIRISNWASWSSSNPRWSAIR